MYKFLLTSDSTTQLAALDCFTVIINHTWPRIPAHKSNLFQTLAEAYTIKSKNQDQVQHKIIQVLHLLKTSLTEPFAPLDEFLVNKQ